MTGLFRLLLTLLSAPTIVSFPGAALAQDRLYRSVGEWKIYSAQSMPGGPMCLGGRVLTSTRDASQRAMWAIGRTIDGRWGMVISGDSAKNMVGRPVVVSVDGRAVHRVDAVTSSSGGSAYLGQLPETAVRSIADGKWLSVEYSSRTLRLHLAGAAGALKALDRCAQEQLASIQKPIANTPSVAEPPPAPPPAERSTSQVAVIGSGTGFYVSTSGHILTNAHVVASSAAIIVSEEGGGVANAYRKGLDATNDLALLQIDRQPHTGSAILSWREDVRLGESVAIYDFPYFGIIAKTGTFAPGAITALAGIRGNSGHLQLSAPVQPGNSGGPVANEQGQIVGVVVGRLSEAYIVDRTGYLPQNVNFGIKSAQARSFLQAHGLTVPMGDLGAPKLSGPDLAARLKAASVLIVCMSG